MIETLPAAVDIEEMIYELREYCCGANAGRWDYIFSIIKRLQSKPEAVLPDRKQVRRNLSQLAPLHSQGTGMKALRVYLKPVIALWLQTRLTLKES